MKKITKKKKVSAGKVIAIGAGVAVLGAGAYYFLGPNGKKNQKKATAWMLKMKKEAKKKVSTIKKVSAPVYHEVVDKLATTYAKQYKAHAPEVKAFAKQLKSKWKSEEKKVKSIKKIIKK